MLKFCNVCNAGKQTDAFAKRAASKDGLCHTCKVCAAARNRAWRAANPNGYRQWCESNPDRKRKAWADWSAQNAGRRSANYARWVEENRGKVYARNAERVAAQLRAMPPWANKAEIESIYRRAVELSAATGVRHEVDHYYPLRGELVCGLHCPANLRVLTRSENARKKNRMPEDCQ